MSFEKSLRMKGYIVKFTEGAFISHLFMLLSKWIDSQLVDML